MLSLVSQNYASQLQLKSEAEHGDVTKYQKAYATVYPLDLSDALANKYSSS